jgi:replicative DNA helicase
MIHENKQLEETVLSALINNPENCLTIASILKVEYLYHFPNKVVYKSILSLLEGNEGIDLMTITMKVKKDGLLADIGGAFFIAQLCEKGYNPTTLENHVRAIHELYILRELSGAAQNIVNEINQPEADPFELI